MIGIAAPLIAGNILKQLYNTVDALVIGRFASQEEFAAIGVAGTVMNLFLFILVGACSGIAVLFAQLYGQKNAKAFRTEHFLSLTLGLAATAILMFLGLFLMPVILRLIQTPCACRKKTLTERAMDVNVSETDTNTISTKNEARNGHRDY